MSIGNFANEMLALYVTQPEALIFADVLIAQGVGAASRLSLTFGVFFFDYDLDGWLDLLTANGHIESEINRVRPVSTTSSRPSFSGTRGAHDAPAVLCRSHPPTSGRTSSSRLSAAAPPMRTSTGTATWMSC